MIRILVIAVWLIHMVGCATTAGMTNGNNGGDPPQDYTVIRVEGHRFNPHPDDSKSVHHDFQAYFALPATPTPQDHFTVDMLDCCVHLSGGAWAYFWGTMPYAKGQKVIVLGGGTRFILETTGNADRVYLLAEENSDPTVYVWRINPDPNEEVLVMKTSSRYIEVTDGTTWPPNEIEVRGSTRHGFAWTVRETVDAHSMTIPWPGQWPDGQ